MSALQRSRERGDRIRVIAELPLGARNQVQSFVAGVFVPRDKQASLRLCRTLFPFPIPHVSDGLGKQLPGRDPS